MTAKVTERTAETDVKKDEGTMKSGEFHEFDAKTTKIRNYYVIFITKY